MPSISPALSRTTHSMTVNLLRSNLRRTNSELLRSQTQLASGLRLHRPSDEPESFGRVSSLQRVLDRFDQRESNLSRASVLTDAADRALGDASNLLLEAQGIASSQIGTGTTPEERRSQARIVDGLIDSLVEIGNRQAQDVHLFAGRRSDERPFVDHPAGVRYTGSRETLAGALGDALPIGINTTGADAFGALSARVAGGVDLDPAATADTRIADVAGARGRGVTLAAVEVTVNGAAARVDLADADTLGDVADRLNNAIGGAGTISISGDGFTLTASGGDSVAIDDIGSGGTAADLGLDIAAAGATTTGGDVHPRLTERTAISSLGAAPDLSGGLKITNAGAAGVVDLAGAATIQDVANRIQTSDLGVRLEINQAGDGLNLVNEVSGSALSVGENAGGTTASDLGLRSFDTDTRLDDFNQGRGVRILEGEADFRIELGDGSTTVDVNLDGATTAGDVIDRINAAASGDATASLAADGNGLVVGDSIGGGGDFRIVPLNGSRAAADLGIERDAGPAATLRGEDTARVRTQSVFSHLIGLRDALGSNDEAGILRSAEEIDGDIGRVAVARATTGVRANRVRSEVDRTATRRLAASSSLSQLRDTDYAEAISRFTQLQQQFQASLQSGSRLLQVSLLDFLR